MLTVIIQLQQVAPSCSKQFVCLLVHFCPAMQPCRFLHILPTRAVKTAAQAFALSSRLLLFVLADQILYIMILPNRPLDERLTSRSTLAGRHLLVAALAFVVVYVVPRSAAQDQVPYNGTAALATSVGTRLVTMATNLGGTQWGDANTSYITPGAGGLYPALSTFGQAHQAPPAAPSRERQIFSAYWMSSTYADDFVAAAIGANETFWGVDLVSHVDGNKTREEVRCLFRPHPLPPSRSHPHPLHEHVRR
jgi:hypothetical protein